MNNIALIEEYIKALIVNINRKNIPKTINIIFDGGAFNGGFAAGIALYLKSMEKHRLLRVHRISGCSIGSVLAVWYLSGCNEADIQEFFRKCMLSYKQNMNLKYYNKNLSVFINDIFINSDKSEEDLLNIFSKQLTITYYHVKKHKQITVSRFRNKDHLIDCILRSSHIPYLINGELSYKKKYMDGITPHIFKNGLPNLFIKLMTFKKCSRAFMIKSENNIHSRLLSGVADVNEFFSHGKSDMCSFVNNWSYYDILQIRVREIICFILFSLIGWIIIIKTYLPLNITNTFLYNGLAKVIFSLYTDIIRKVLI